MVRMANDTKRSKVETIKEQSDYLRGELAQEIANEEAFISQEGYELLKFHGSYQGYDRDTATERKKAGLDKEWEFMVRMKCPGGRLTAQQYLQLDDICEQYANGTLRITTRQTFQFHCVVKKHLKLHIAAINEALLTTLGGCGDVNRNVLCCPAPVKGHKQEKLLHDTQLLAEFCAPKTSAYHEIWLNGKDVTSLQATDTVEPLYGKHYLPRKFKIALGVAEDNCVDVLANDLAILLVYEDQEFKGYNIFLGGGLGMTHNKPATYPRLATPVAFVPPGKLVRITEAVIKLQRDHGDRSDRKHARLKYVVEEKGTAWVRSTLEEYYGEKLDNPLPVLPSAIVDHMGWHSQGDGKWYLGVPVSSGRIVDRAEEKIKTGLRQIVEQYNTDVTLTADQNIILCNIRAKDKEPVTTLLKQYGIKLQEDITPVYRHFIACVALPTCGKALAEAERVKLPLVAEIEKVMEKHGITKETIAIRMAGCPNGCSRPYIGDIGIVGRMPGSYAMFIGGDFTGTRLNQKILDKVPFDHIPSVLDILFARYSKEKTDQEGFGDFAYRVGIEHIAGDIEAKLGEQYPWAKII